MSKRIVIKIGSSLLSEERGCLSHDKLKDHVEALCLLHAEGHEVVLVTSGAVAAGFPSLGYADRPAQVVAKQASAAVGQGMLIHAYAQEFSKQNIVVAQILLSKRDFRVRESYNNVLNALNLMFEKRVIPIINENDVVALKQVSFGDNDVLAALVAALVHADLLMIFTDIDGLYNGHPKTDPQATRIDHVAEITAEIKKLAGGTGSSVGTGGMASKIKAAEVALSMGVEVFIGDGKNTPRDRLLRALAGEGAGTYFGGKKNQMNRKKQWLAFHSDVKGQIVIDAGARKALLEDGRSLLPAGVVRVVGDFNSEDVIEVASVDGQVLGKGIAQYDSKLLEQVKSKSSDFVRELAKAQKVEVIHRDNWVKFID